MPEDTELDNTDVNAPTVFAVKCIHCNDAGIVHPVTESGKPDYSQVVPCRYCQTPEKVARLLGISSMSATFDNLMAVKGLEKALKLARQIATLKTEWKLLLIHGGWGNGKTHLLESISIELWNKGIYAKVQTFPDFMGRLKSTFNRSKEDNGQTFNAIMDNVCVMPYLLMDDVGVADSYTDFSRQQLERIILARYRQELFTVMTTNKDLTELPGMVRSRFSDSKEARIVLNGAPDYRPLKGK